MILYFNCRITNVELNPNTINSGYFYPQVFPKGLPVSKTDSQFKVLLKTIESYSRIKFESVIFNIVLDNQEVNEQKELRDVIYKSFPDSRISLNFTRPSTLKEWIAAAEKLGEFINPNAPMLVMMNHDHPLVDLDGRIFNKIVEKIFSPTVNNRGKVFYYCCAPEVISWAINGRGKVGYNQDMVSYRQVSPGIYESSIVNTWVDSIGVMTLETLKHIWLSAKFSGDYIGRFDWKGVSYDRLELKTYVFPREFFKHFDGDTHITGMRLISEMNLSKEFLIPFPEYHLLHNYYYQKWLDCFLIAIRDYFIIHSSCFKSKKMTYIEGIEKSIELFKIGYLEQDVSMGLIDQQLLPELENGLRNKIYFNGNYLYQQIVTDIDLLMGNGIKKLKRAFIKILPIPIVKYLLKWYIAFFVRRRS